MCAAAFAAAVSVAPAQALTLGNTTLPAGANMGSACGASANAVEVQLGTDSSYNYTVPSGGGSITSWSVNTTGATAGSPYTLLVVRPSGTSYTIVGEDTETLPSPLPAVATFSLAKPITVQGGDGLGIMFTAGKNTVHCLFHGGGGPLPNADETGGSLKPGGVGSSFSIVNMANTELVNVAATVVQSNDIAVTQKAEPAGITLGDDGVFVLNVTNTGPSSTPVTLTDTLPAGLTLVSASAGTSPCTTSGQTVTCSLPSAPASVALVVSATAPGTYTNAVSAQGTILDPNTSNNSASATLTVSGSATTSLTGLSAAGNGLGGPAIDVGLAIHPGPITL